MALARIQLVKMGIIAVAITVTAGTHYLQPTNAAVSSNPYGFADYCLLENNTTVIYGWASDANATSLTQPTVQVVINGTTLTLPTDRATIHDAGINHYISHKYPDDPKPGTYGFRAVFSGLYKGNRYPITGTLINVGAGMNVPMSINQSNPLDVNPNLPIFKDGVLPDACLAARPVPPPPPPPAPIAPAPKPVAPRPAPSPSPAKPPLSGAADASVAVGTTGATFKVPPGNAARVQIKYGQDPAAPDQSSPEIPTNGADTEIGVSQLSPKQTYGYQIVRIGADGSIVASPTATFTTTGLSIALKFKKNNQPVSGIAVAIERLDLKGTSDKAGIARFQDVAPGAYLVAYTISGKTNTTRIDVTLPDEPDADAQPTDVQAREFAVDLSDAKQTAAAEPSRNSKTPLIIGVVLGSLLLIPASLLLLRRRRRAHTDEVVGHAEPDIDYAPAQIQLQPVEPETEHMGESLREMVVRSMYEQAGQNQPGASTAPVAPQPPLMPPQPPIGPPPSLPPQVPLPQAPPPYSPPAPPDQRQ